jgi:hypothetical protein
VTEPLDFRWEADAGSTSWKRGAPGRALIERRSWNEWAVFLPDGEDSHVVRLERDHGAYVGECDCWGFRGRDDPESPCAHLCTLRQAESGHYDDVDGNRVRILDADEERAQSIDRAVADGGRRWCR